MRGLRRNKGPTWHGTSQVSMYLCVYTPPNAHLLERLNLWYGILPGCTRVEAGRWEPQHSSIGSLESQPGGATLLTY